MSADALRQAQPPLPLLPCSQRDIDYAVSHGMPTVMPFQGDIVILVSKPSHQHKIRLSSRKNEVGGNVSTAPASATSSLLSVLRDPPACLIMTSCYNRLTFVGTNILFLVPVVLFSGFVAPYIWVHLSHIPIYVFAYMAIVTISSLYRAALSDPGIQPRYTSTLLDSSLSTSTSMQDATRTSFNFSASNTPREANGDPIEVNYYGHKYEKAILRQQQEQYDKRRRVATQNSVFGEMASANLLRKLEGASTRHSHTQIHTTAELNDQSHFSTVQPSDNGTSFHFSTNIKLISEHPPSTISGLPESSIPSISAPNNPLSLELKYCVSCKLYRHPRAYHCGTCNNCVLNHDHCCPWISNCVGQNNYLFFLSFITEASFSLLLIAGLSIYQLAHAVKTPIASVSLTQANPVATEKFLTFSDALTTYPVAAVLLVYVLIIGSSIIGLTAYHWFLVAQNLSTREHIKFSVKRYWRNPFSRGSVFANIAWVLFHPRPSSTLRSLPHIYPTIHNAFSHDEQIV